MTRSRDTPERRIPCQHGQSHPRGRNGKEGVVGSSPTEGLGFLPAQGMLAGAGAPSWRLARAVSWGLLNTNAAKEEVENAQRLKLADRTIPE